MQTDPTLHHLVPPTATSGFRFRLRELLLAWMLGIAVVIWPGDSSSRRSSWLGPPAFVRALRWRDIIRMRLAPWLVLHDSEPARQDRPLS